MIQGLNTIANMVLGSVCLAVKSTTVMTISHHSIKEKTMKKTAVALLTLLGLAVLVKVVRDQI